MKDIEIWKKLIVGIFFVGQKFRIGGSSLGLLAYTGLQHSSDQDKSWYFDVDLWDQNIEGLRPLINW